MITFFNRCFLGLGLCVAAHAASIHSDYLFNGNLSDGLGNGAAMIGSGSLATPGVYTFGYGQGLTLNHGLSDGSNYSLRILFNFTDSAAGWKRILDMNQPQVEEGLYFYNHQASYWTTGTHPFGPAIAPGSGNLADMVVTRDGTTTRFYVNGLLGYSINTAVTNAAGKPFLFFRDNTSENGQGFVDRITVWNGALTGDEVAALSANAVPEPGCIVLLGSGLAAIAMARRKR